MDYLHTSLVATKAAELRRLYEQLKALNDSIEQRTDAPFANEKEAQVYTRLTTAIRKLETETSLATFVDCFRKYLDWLRNEDLDTAKIQAVGFDRFLNQL